MTARLSHLDAAGHAHMVDVGAKAVTSRSATAKGFVRMSAAALRLVTEGAAPKGDVLAAARIAGIMAAKKTADLIPLCHPLPITRVSIALAPGTDGIEITASVSVSGQTGVEMEALTAVTVAALTVYDMVKAADKAMRIEDVRLVFKDGGRSGRYEAE